MEKIRRTGIIVVLVIALLIAITIVENNKADYMYRTQKNYVDLCVQAFPEKNEAQCIFEYTYGKGK